MKRLLTILFCVCLTMTLAAQSVKQLQQQRKQAENQLAETKRLLAETNKDEKNTANKLGLLQADIQTRQQLINTINRELIALDLEKDSLQAYADSLNLCLDSLKNDYAELVRQSYYVQKRKLPLLFILSSNSFQQLYHRMRYLQDFTSYRQTQIIDIETLKHQIEQQQTLLTENRQAKEEALRVQEREQANLESDKRKQQRALNDLQSKKSKLEKQQKEQQRKANELNKKIDEMIAAEAKKAANASTLTKEQKLVSGNFEKNKGKLPWPTERGVVVGQFGEYQHSVHKHVTRNNPGIYIQTTMGSDCRSVFDGEVTATFVSGGQNVVIVRHGAYLSIYSNLTTLYVKNGDKVKTKQKIGKIYTDKENDNQTVLYFQIRKETEVLNPSDWLSK